jgi:8-oxo-dGTP pyrophosphatase MutT (NUDIX family)
MKEIKLYLQHSLLSIYPPTTLTLDADIQLFMFDSPKFMDKIFALFDSSYPQKAAIIHEHPTLVLKSIIQHFIEIPAAGGLIENGNGDLLLMKRRGFWDLPKGKIDQGETIPQAAIREVEEETGLTNVTLGNLLQITYHGYMFKGQRAIKPAYWYAMSVSGVPETHPQIEEDITQLIWIKKNDVTEYLPKSLPTIQDLIQDWSIK